MALLPLYLGFDWQHAYREATQSVDALSGNMANADKAAGAK
jgi:hypothetical protein